MPFNFDKFLKDTNEYYKIHGRDATFVEAEDKIVAMANPECIFRFARRVPCADIIRLQEVVINLKSAEFIRKFAAHIKGANRKMLEEALLKTKDAKQIALYCRDVQIKDLSLIHRIEDILLESDNLGAMLEFDTSVAEGKSGRIHEKIMEASKQQQTSSSINL